MTIQPWTKILIALLLLGLAACDDPYELKQGEFRDCDKCPIMVEIPPGSFMMGSPESEAGRDADEGPVHKVTINYRFAVSRYEITQGQWKAIVGYDKGKQPSKNHPINYVSWEIAKSFVKILSEKTKRPYRLLTEAEWEYVARAGSTGQYSFGAITPEKAAYDTRFSYEGSSRARLNRGPHVVGSYQPNLFGIYDMHGNVSEWVEDCYVPNYIDTPRDGSAATRRMSRHNCWSKILRGGNAISRPENIRSASRFSVHGKYTTRDLGLRVARDLD